MNARSHLVAASCVSAALLLIAGCETANRDAERTAARPAGLVLTSDPAVEAQLDLVGPRIVRRADQEFLDLELQSKARMRQRIQVWIEWYDHGGARIETAADGWTPLDLDAGARRNLSIPVPVAGVGSWRLHAARIDGRL